MHKLLRGFSALDGALGYCPQQSLLYNSLTVNQHLDFFRAAYGIRDLRCAEELIERLGYTGYRTSVVGTLSGGTKQELNLTLALMHRPAVLLLVLLVFWRHGHRTQLALIWLGN